MPRLNTLRPGLNALAPRIGSARDASGHGRSAEPWRKWYGTKRWALLRADVFERDGYTCQMEGCDQVVADPVCDHVEPHRGDPVLFWSPANLQTLCKPCHDGAKQRAEREAQRLGGVSIAGRGR